MDEIIRASRMDDFSDSSCDVSVDATSNSKLVIDLAALSDISYVKESGTESINSTTRLSPVIETFTGNYVRSYTDDNSDSSIAETTKQFTMVMQDSTKNLPFDTCFDSEEEISLCEVVEKPCDRSLTLTSCSERDMCDIHSPLGRKGELNHRPQETNANSKAVDASIVVID
mmetsp:Transcript_22437/g.34287  ORF Transcript_22437/g.34287 Transcript_22437/m.34287 type:complete len:171 (+) Transcript_22437:1-513(+)